MMLLMMNAVYSEHQDLRPECHTIQLKLHHEQKMGLGSRLKFQCDSCNFVSSAMETYEKRKDSNGAAINMMLASALQDMAIGIEKANLLFLSTDIPPPSRSHLQTLVNAASQNTGACCSKPSLSVILLAVLAKVIPTISIFLVEKL